MDNIDISYEEALRMAQYLFKNIEDAEDICQEAYSEYINGEARGKPILYRRIIDAARHISPFYDSRVSNPDTLEIPMSILVEEDESFDIFGSCGGESVMLDYFDTFNYLYNEKTLTIIKMRMEGYDQESIALQLNISQPRVCQILKKALRELREYEDE